MRLYRPHSPIVILYLSLLIFLVSNSLIFNSGLYKNYLDPKGRSYSADFSHSIKKMRQYSSKNGILLLGSSEFRWPTDKKLLVTNTPVKPNIIMPNNTNEESWYYLLKLGDPNKNKYKLVVIGLPRYRISPEYNIRKNLTTAQSLAASLNWTDYLEVVKNYPSFSSKLKVLELKLFQSMLYPDQIVFQIFRGFRKKSFTDRKEKQQKFLDDHRGTWTDLILDKQNNLVACKPPQDIQTCREIQKYKIPLSATIANHYTEQNFIFKKIWIQKIIDYYQGTNTKLLFVELPHAPGITTGSPITNAPDIREYVHLNKNSTFLPESEFEDLSSVNFMHDPYHMSPSVSRPIFTPRLNQILNDNFSK